MQFADRIASIRKEMNFSQEKFGELVNVSQRTVAYWESGERTPSNAVISDLADKLAVSVDYLLGRSDSKAVQTQKEPTVSDDGLRVYVVSRIQSLSDPALERVRDFLSGLEAGQAIGPGPAAAPGSDDPPAE